jgi:hypothetical protein
MVERQVTFAKPRRERQLEVLISPDYFRGENTVTDNLPI